jgi:hypothetical protein
MEIIYCREGISQGGVLGMSLYGIATLTLAFGKINEKSNTRCTTTMVC